MPSGLQVWSKTAASNATADTSINWAEGQAPSSVNDSARAMMARIAEWRDDISGALTTSGSSTAYAVTSNRGFALAAAMDGSLICAAMHVTNAASPTLNVDGLGAKPIAFTTGEVVPADHLAQSSVPPTLRTLARDPAADENLNVHPEAYPTAGRRSLWCARRSRSGGTASLQLLWNSSPQ